MKTSLLLLLLASASAMADDYTTRQYQQDHLNELRRQTRAIESSRVQAEHDSSRGLTTIGGNAYYSRGAAVAATLDDLARKLDRRAAPSCIVVNGRVFCEGN